MLAFLILFISSAAWVFVMAFQSRNINAGEYVWAGLGSFFIGTLQVFVLSSVIGPNGTLLHTFIYCAGGSLGVVSAMYAHNRLFTRKR